MPGSLGFYPLLLSFHQPRAGFYEGVLLARTVCMRAAGSGSMGHAVLAFKRMGRAEAVPETGLRGEVP